MMIKYDKQSNLRVLHTLFLDKSIISMWILTCLKVLEYSVPTLDNF